MVGLPGGVGGLGVCVLLGAGVAFVLGVDPGVFAFWCNPVGRRRHFTPRTPRNKMFLLVCRGLLGVEAWWWFGREWGLGFSSW